MRLLIIMLQMLGLKCEEGKRVGPEKCLCNCSYAIPTDDCFDKLCTNSQTCFKDACHNECLNLPFYNVESCFCFKEICEDGSYCNLISGCQNFPECPIFPIFPNFCMCVKFCMCQIFL